MITATSLNLAGLIVATIAALLMAFFPPTLMVYTDKGESVISWVGTASEKGRRRAAMRRWLSRMAVALLVVGFALQLLAAVIPERTAPPPVTREHGVSPPAECAGAQTAKECADILERLGKNPFDAFGFSDATPTYGKHREIPAPPCKSGAAACEPWERDWKGRHLEPGSIITDQGNVVTQAH